MGSPDFALPSLEQLNDSAHHIRAVITGPDKRRGRGNKRSPTPVKTKADNLNLPVIEVDDLRSNLFAKQLKTLDADLFVVVAFKILPANILKIPTIGSVNLHASLLPEYRGAAPIHRAIINGEKETGCTVFMLDKTVDTGEIITQCKTNIAENETTGDLYNRLKKDGAELLLRSIDEIENNSYSLRKQDEKRVSAAPKIFSDDCKIDFHQPALKVHNKIRGLSPFPTAWAALDDLKFNIYRSKLGPAVSLKPGELIMADDELLAGCDAGTVILEKVQLQGKRKISGKSFMNGYHGTGLLH